MKRRSLAVGLMLPCLYSVGFADWPQWRGPHLNNVADGPAPTEWDTTKNVRWKTPIPGRGHSSPIVVGDRIILTSADPRTQVQAVLAFDRDTGKSLWVREVNRGGFAPQIHSKNTYASPTVASDGERLFAVFSHHNLVQLVALDLDGKPLWNKNAGPYQTRKYQFGYAASPAIYDSLVIVSSEFDGDDAFLAAFDRETGKEVWRTRRPVNISYSSPIVGKVAGKDQLIISGADMVAGYEPKTGKQLWTAEGIATATCGTVVWEGDLVFASGGFPQSETAAIKADGSGEVVWRNREQCYEQSMLVHDGYLYAVNDKGIAFCWDAEDGTQMWSERLVGPISASPVLAGDHIYVTNERGKTFVFRANPKEFELVATNQLGDEGFPTMAICDGKIYIRAAHWNGNVRQETLYCIGEQDR